jgi:CBS domain-containing protein
MQVQEVMTRVVRSATPAMPLHEVAAVMCLNRLSGLPVVEADDTLLGFVAERDILHRMFPKLDDLMDSTAITDFEEMEEQYGDVMNLKVGDVMTPGVISVKPDMPALKAASVMVRNRFRRIPVVVEKKLVGIVSIGDIHKAIFKQNLTKR